MYRHRKGKNKSASPFHLEKFDTKKWGKGRRGRSERRSIATVQRRRRVRTAQLEPEEFRRLDISSNDHPARSGRPINRQDLAWLAGDRPWEKFASPHASPRSIDFIVGARRCIWCGKISRSSPSSPSVLLPYSVSHFHASNFNRFFSGKRKSSLSLSFWNG